MCKIWCKYKLNGKIIRGKDTGRIRRMSKPQDKKLKAIWLNNRKCTANQMKNKWGETGVNVCDRIRVLMLFVRKGIST